MDDAAFKRGHLHEARSGLGVRVDELKALEKERAQWAEHEQVRITLTRHASASSSRQRTLTSLLATLRRPVASSAAASGLRNAIIRGKAAAGGVVVEAHQQRGVDGVSLGGDLAIGSALLGGPHEGAGAVQEPRLLVAV
jgi:hypothetical protein